MAWDWSLAGTLQVRFCRQADWAAQDGAQTPSMLAASTSRQAGSGAALLPFPPPAQLMNCSNTLCHDVIFFEYVGHRYLEGLAACKAPCKHVTRPRGACDPYVDTTSVKGCAACDGALICFVLHASERELVKQRFSSVLHWLRQTEWSHKLCSVCEPEPQARVNSLPSAPMLLLLAVCRLLPRRLQLLPGRTAYR